jgi:hypothetical protein
MAVSVNTVYKTVLFILNKEQRGYVTPAEFNSIAEQVQFQIFESYFPDGNQQFRKNQNNSQNGTEFFDMFKDISYKLYPFEEEVPFTYNAAKDGFAQTPFFGQVISLYKIGEVISNYTSVNPSLASITQLVSKSDFSKISRSKLTAPDNKNPLFFTTNDTEIIANQLGNLLLKVTPTPNTITVNALVAPTPPNWGFTVGGLGQYIYDPNSSTDFQLDGSEQTLLVLDILKYFGIVVNDPTIIQVASQEAQQMEINEKS